MAVSEELKIVIRAEARGAINELKQVQGVSNKVDTSFKSIAKSLLGALGLTAGIVGLTRGMTGFISKGIKFNAQLEQLDVAFTSILGSASRANELVEELKEFSTSTPFQMIDLAQGAQVLLGFGTQAKDIVATMEDLGNASLGSQEKLNRLIQAYGKLQAKGKASLEELNMFTEAGVPIMQALQEQLGLTKEELFDFVTKGKIGFEEVDAALQALTRGEGKLAGIIEGQSKTLSGVMSTLKDNVTALAASMTEDFVPSITKAASEVTALIKHILELKEIADIRGEAREGIFVDFAEPLSEQVAQAQAGIKTLTADLKNLRDSRARELEMDLEFADVSLIDREIARSARRLEDLELFVGGTRDLIKAEQALADELAERAAAEKATADRQVKNLARLAAEYARTQQGAIDAKREALAFLEGLSDRGPRTVEAIKNVREELELLIATQQIGGATKANAGKPIPGGLLPQTFDISPNINPFAGIEQGVGNLNAEDFGVPALTNNLLELGSAFKPLDQQLLITGESFKEFNVSAQDINDTVSEMVEDGSMKLAVNLFSELGSALATGADMGQLFLQSAGKILGMLSEIFLWGALAAFKSGFTELGTAYLVAAGVTGLFGGVASGTASTIGRAPSSSSVSRGTSGTNGTVYGAGTNIQNITQNIAGSVLAQDQLDANAASASRMVTSGR